MARGIAACALAFAVCLPSPASAWGVEGHQVVAALAEDMLTPNAKTAVVALLAPAGGSTTLASVSTWADDIRTLRPQTRTWHYITLENDQPHPDPARADTPNAVTALERQLAILARPIPDRYAREEALKWVVHLVGDLHQPLHTGEDHDKGGNLAQVKVNRRSYNLHAVWDYVLLERLHLPVDSLKGMLEREIASESGWLDRNAQGTPSAWAMASHALAPDCYMLRGKRMRKGIKIQLDRDYVHAATLTTLAQLKLAGARLAFALNQALDPGGFGTFLRAAGPRPDGEAYFAHADGLDDADSGEAGGTDTLGRSRGASPDKHAPNAAAGAAPVDSSMAGPATGTRRDAIRTDSAGEGAAAAASPKPDHGRKRLPPIEYKRFSWSGNSQVFHFSICADVRRILRKNLKTADRPPEGKSLHKGCPIP